MANVLSNDKQQQILALGRLGWSLRRIEGATGVRRETASAYLKAAGIQVRPAPQARAAAKPANEQEVSTDSATAKPASGEGVSTDPGACARPKRAPTASACEPYREEIEQALRLGRNAMAIYQDLVTERGFGARYASVKRFVRKLDQCLRIQHNRARPVGPRPLEVELHLVPGQKVQGLVRQRWTSTSHRPQ
jgi:hypothetical protein